MKTLILCGIIMLISSPAQNLTHCSGDSQSQSLRFKMAGGDTKITRITLGSTCPDTTTVMDVSADQAFIAVKPVGHFTFDIIAKPRDMTPGDYNFKLTATSPTWDAFMFIPGVVTVTSR